MILNKIINTIKNNGIVAIPTDTIYGLIGNPLSKIAVEKIYTLKQRKKDKKLSIFLKSCEDILDICKTTSFIEDFIFNKLNNDTIILEKKNKDYLNLISDNTIGIRVPNNKYLLEILNEFQPLFATSINISGQKELLNYDDIIENFNDKIDLIINNDTIPQNKCSNIFKIENDKIIQIR